MSACSMRKDRRQGDRRRPTPMACAARRGVARHGQAVYAAIESMNGARFVHDQLERQGWEVEFADAFKVKGLAPLAAKTDRIDASVLAELARRDLVPAIWLPTPGARAERERARFRLHLVRHRTALKNRIHATLIAFGHAPTRRSGRHHRRHRLVGLEIAQADRSLASGDRRVHHRRHDGQGSDRAHGIHPVRRPRAGGGRPSRRLRLRPTAAFDWNYPTPTPTRSAQQVP